MQGPFNMLNQVHDLNSALVSYAMMETSVFISSAGVIGPKKIVEHDVSLLVPEVWSVSTPAGSVCVCVCVCKEEGRRARAGRDA